MFSTFQKVLVTATLLLVSSAAASAETFAILNQTSYAIDRVYVSRSGDRYWGNDRLGSQVLYPDYRMTLDLYPGWYDVKLVDSDGDSCVVNDVDFRSENTWTLNNALLGLCELGTALR